MKGLVAHPFYRMEKPLPRQARRSEESLFMTITCDARAAIKRGLLNNPQGVAQPVKRLNLSSRLRRCDVIRGVVGEFGVDAGGPAADTVDVGAEFGECAGIGVDDPAVRVPGFLASGDASLVQPLADGAGGHAEFGREQWQPPFVFSRCVVGVGGQGLAPVGDRRSRAVQDLGDEAVADRSGTAGREESFGVELVGDAPGIPARAGQFGDPLGQMRE